MVFLWADFTDLLLYCSYFSSLSLFHKILSSMGSIQETWREGRREAGGGERESSLGETKRPT